MRDAVAWLALSAVILALILWDWWEGPSTGYRGFGWVYPIAVPLVGVGVSFVQGIALVRASRAVVDRSPARIRAGVVSLVAALLLAASLPLGYFVRSVSAAESKRRAEVVGSALREFHRREGRWPKSLDELPDARSLPRPTFRGGWYYWANDDVAYLSFMFDAFLGAHDWSYDLSTGVWRDHEN